MTKLLIQVDTKSNKNKYYKLILEGDTVIAEYGRVGSNPQTRRYSGGQRTFNKKLNEKLRKGYVESKVIVESQSSNMNLMQVAMDQIKTDEASKELLKELVRQNIHNITSSTRITYNEKTGIFSTPLGIITQDGVEEALKLLDKIDTYQDQMGKLSDKKYAEFVEYNEKYFMIIPTKISNLRNYKNLLITPKLVQSQRDICEALSKSLSIVDNVKSDLESDEVIFKTEIKELTDEVEYSRLVKFFEDSKNQKHGKSNYKINNIYCVSIGDEEEKFRSDLPNQMELFHGTKIANMLSILKSGLLMPKYSPGSVTGYMFGQGLYFASQSTKSLNYCDGGYWNNTKKQSKIFMFIADVAMGNYKVPNGPVNKKPDNGYDSYWAKPGISGIMNDEMIIFNNNQIKLKYILEIIK